MNARSWTHADTLAGLGKLKRITIKGQEEFEKRSMHDDMPEFRQESGERLACAKHL
jgi:hypothetical protein